MCLQIVYNAILSCTTTTLLEFNRAIVFWAAFLMALKCYANWRHYFTCENYDKQVA